MADGDGAATALGLDGFADVVLNVGIKHRQIAHRQPGVITGGETSVLAGQPFLGAVGAQMDQRVGLVLPLQIQIGGHIERIGDAVGVMVMCRWISGARHLRHHQQPSEPPAWNDKIELAVHLPHSVMAFGFTAALQFGST